ncbi:M50 family metallopeptidase [Nocardiopsis oceani]
MNAQDEAGGADTGDGAAPMRPSIRDDIVVGPPLIRRGRSIHVIKDPVADRLMTVGTREHFIITRLDGRNSLRDIADEYRTVFHRTLDDRSWGTIMGTLARRRLLTGTAPRAPGHTPDRQTEPQRGLVRARLAVARPDVPLGALARRIGLVFSPWFVVSALVAVAVTLLVAVLNAPVLVEAVQETWSRPWIGLLVFVVLWGFFALHEIGHGVAAKHYGARVAEIGVQWRLPLLSPYCAVEDVQVLPRRQRVHIAFAGVFVSLLVMPPVLLLWWAVPEGGTAHTFVSLLLFCGLVAGLVNFLPFLGLDGYTMLNHALGMENLARDSFAHVGASVRGRFGKGAQGVTGNARDAGDGQGLGSAQSPRWVRSVYVAYAVTAGFFYTTLAAAALVLWFVLLELVFGALAAVLILAGTALVITGLYRLVALRQRRSRTAGAKEDSDTTQPRNQESEKRKP